MNEPEVVRWLTDHIDKMITDEGIDLYRSDYNIDPLGFWRGNDTEDRRGITEIQYIEGHLSYWDELQRHPGMVIDSCASGGRRNDLETMRRAVPLLRSDYRFEPQGTQGYNYGISFWLPYHGTKVVQSDPYIIRTHFFPFLTFGWSMPDKTLDYALFRCLIDQFRQVAPDYLGDYYPLTAYSSNASVWMAWQFNRMRRGRCGSLLLHHMDLSSTNSR